MENQMIDRLQEIQVSRGCVLCVCVCVCVCVVCARATGFGLGLYFVPQSGVLNHTSQEVTRQNMDAMMIEHLKARGHILYLAYYT